MNTQVLKKYNIKIRNVKDRLVFKSNSYALSMFLNFHWQKSISDDILRDLNFALTNQFNQIEYPEAYWAEIGGEVFSMGKIKNDGTFYLHNDEDKGIHYPISDIKEIFLSIQEFCK